MNDSSTSRRQFLKASALAGGALLAPAILTPPARGASDAGTLRLGLIGCGGRGTSAASQAMAADPNVVLTAMGDVFEDRLQTSLQALQENSRQKVQVDPDHCFIGLDAFEKVINSGVDVVILATPPAFRPRHLQAAIAAGKHVFCEKPVATDAPGVRSVLASVEAAKQKNLTLVSGFCWRYNLAEQALFERILDGKIGGVQVVYGTYYTGAVRPMPSEADRKPGMSDVEWQLRNWYNFAWLSGDSLVEQAVHAVDWMCWAMGDQPPARAVAVGGRQIPSPGGNIFDHFEVNYEYANGARGFIGSRQQSGCANNNTATIYGTQGVAHELGFGGMPFIKSAEPWRYTGARPNMYEVEHQVLFNAIRTGKTVNNGVRMAYTTLAALMGRMAAYTGQEISWEMALNSQETLVPPHLTWDMALPVVPRAEPGITRFS